MPYVHDPKKVFLLQEQKVESKYALYIQRFTKCGVALVVDDLSSPPASVMLALPFFGSGTKDAVPLALIVQDVDPEEDEEAVAQEWAESDADLRILDWRLTYDQEPAEPTILCMYTDKIGHVRYAVFIVPQGQIPEILCIHEDRASAERILENPANRWRAA